MSEMMQYKDQWSSYRLNGSSIESPDGEGGWYVIDDDCPYADDRSGFESRCDFLSEELRILMAEAEIEFS